MRDGGHLVDDKGLSLFPKCLIMNGLHSLLESLTEKGLASLIFPFESSMWPFLISAAMT